MILLISGNLDIAAAAQRILSASMSFGIADGGVRQYVVGDVGQRVKSVVELIVTAIT